jgi:hypothetical protein
VAAQIPPHGKVGRSWRVSYLPQGLSPLKRGETNNVTIVEESPALPEAKLKPSQKIVVNGRHVSLRPPNGRFSLYIATWKTAHARYLMLANGNRPDALKRFIACLP